MPANDERPEDNNEGQNNQHQQQAQQNNTANDNEGGSVSKFFSWASRVTDKIPEGPIAGHVIPGWMAAHKVITGMIFGVAALAVGSIGLGAYHAWHNSNYGDEYRELLNDIARESAITCDLGDQGRREDTYSRIQGDVRDSGDASIFGIITAPLGWLPVVGGWMPEFEWMPNKRIYDALDTANDNDVRLFHGNMFEDGVDAVLFNDGENPPVMVYRSLDDGQLLEMMSAVRENGVINQGALVLSWNDAAERFETQQVALDAEEVMVMDGLATAPIPPNSCLTDTSLTTRAFEGARGMIPTFGFGGDSDDEAEAEETLEETPVIEAEETEPTADEDDGWSFRDLKFWGNDDDEAPEADEAEPVEEDHSSFQPVVRAPTYG